MEVRLQPLARHKVASLGEAGRDWLDALPATLRALTDRALRRASAKRRRMRAGA